MKQFFKTKSYFWLHVFIVASILVLGMVLSVDASPKKYKGQIKVEREYRKRNALCIAEQERIQHQGIKHYNPRNKWQKHNKRK